MRYGGFRRIHRFHPRLRHSEKEVVFISGKQYPRLSAEVGVETADFPEHRTPERHVAPDRYLRRQDLPLLVAVPGDPVDPEHLVLGPGRPARFEVRHHAPPDARDLRAAFENGGHRLEPFRKEVDVVVDERHDFPAGLAYGPVLRVGMALYGFVHVADPGVSRGESLSDLPRAIGGVVVHQQQFVRNLLRTDLEEAADRVLERLVSVVCADDDADQRRSSRKAALKSGTRRRRPLRLRPPRPGPSALRKWEDWLSVSRFSSHSDNPPGPSPVLPIERVFRDAECNALPTLDVRGVIRFRKHPFRCRRAFSSTRIV
jgi:hypothetical protein